MSDTHLKEERVGSQELFKGNFLEARRDTIRLPDGKTATRESVVHPGGVVVIPLLEEPTPEEAPTATAEPTLEKEPAAEQEPELSSCTEEEAPEGSPCTQGESSPCEPRASGSASIGRPASTS